jgi:hypothetical protein
MAKGSNTKKEKRYTRDEPERKAPNRKPGDYVRRNASSRNDDERKYAEPQTLVGQSMQQVISDMVQLSKSVIEEQIQAGQASASRMRDNFSSSDKLSGNMNSVVNSLAAATKDIGDAWVELLTIIITAIGTKPPPGGHPAPGGSAPPPTRTWTGSSGGAQTTCHLTPADPQSQAEPPEIAVTGSGAKGVTLDLKPPAARFVPVVHPLLTSDLKNRIDGVKFGLNAQRKLVLTVNVPRGQPPGTYTGAVVDSATSKAGGTVSVTVGD